MADIVKTLVALDEGVDTDKVRAALPENFPEIQIVGLVQGLEESWRMLQETPTDLLVIGCSGYSDRALFLIDGAAKQQPERPVVVLSDGSPNGFVRRVFEAGADDIVLLPADAGPASASRSRRWSPASRAPRWRTGVATRADDLRARAEGRHAARRSPREPRGRARRSG